MNKTLIIVALVVALSLGAYLMFFKKKVPAAASAPPAYRTTQNSQSALTGALDIAASAAATAGTNAAVNWLSNVSW